MPLEQEPIEATVGRADRTIRWHWPEGAFAGPYDPGNFWVQRGEDRDRGYMMEVDREGEGSLITVHFRTQPEAGEEIHAPDIS